MFLAKTKGTENVACACGPIGFLHLLIVVHRYHLILFFSLAAFAKGNPYKLLNSVDSDGKFFNTVFILINLPISLFNWW